jgi:hypothetical protein
VDWLTAREGRKSTIVRRIGNGSAEPLILEDGVTVAIPAVAIDFIAKASLFIFLRGRIEVQNQRRPDDINGTSDARTADVACWHF